MVGCDGQSLRGGGAVRAAGECYMLWDWGVGGSERGAGGVGGRWDQQDKTKSRALQVKTHPTQTHTKGPFPPVCGLRTRADITPCVTATSREAFFGFEEGGELFLSFWWFLDDFDLSANQ